MGKYNFLGDFDLKINDFFMIMFYFYLLTNFRTGRDIMRTKQKKLCPPLIRSTNHARLSDEFFALHGLDWSYDFPPVFTIEWASSWYFYIRNNPTTNCKLLREISAILRKKSSKNQD